VKIDAYIQPSSEEARELHELMLEVIEKDVTEIAGQKLIPMKDTEASIHLRTVVRPVLISQIESVQLMFPQDRNLHGKVFGGILMRMVSGLLSRTWLD
jgi:acyl-coenzyme A thioesterase 9